MLIPLISTGDINKIKKIDILKIDTQGYEDKILAGSKNILKTILLIL